MKHKPLELRKLFDRVILRNKRKGSGDYTDWIEIDVYEDPEEGSRCAYIFVAAYSDVSFLRFTILHDGIPDWWQEELIAAGPGFYRITYSHYTDGEYEDGYRVSKYETMDSITKLEKDWRARPAMWLHKTFYCANLAVYYALSPFRKQWCMVHRTSDTSSIVTRPTWIWQALWATILHKIGLRNQELLRGSRLGTYHFRHAHYTLVN